MGVQNPKDEKISDEEGEEIEEFSETGKRKSRKIFGKGTRKYKVYTKEFDEVTNAENLESEEELLRLRTSLDQQLLQLRNFISKLANKNKIKTVNCFLDKKNLKKNDEPKYVRMHKLDITKDIFEEKNLFGDEISKSFKIIEERGSGAIVLINSDMAPKIEKIFNRRETKDNKLELREYGVGAQILLELGLRKIILLSNSNKKIIALDGFNLEIVSQEKF